MSFFSKKIKECGKTQVMSKGFRLDELLNEKILKEIKEMFKEDYELITVTDLVIQLKPKIKPKTDIKSKEKKKIIITTNPWDSINFTHPSEKHYNNKLTVITANRNIVLEKLLKK